MADEYHCKTLTGIFLEYYSRDGEMHLWFTILFLKLMVTILAGLDKNS